MLRSTEHQPVSTTIVSYMACVSGLVSGEHVLDAVVVVLLGIWVVLSGCCWRKKQAQKQSMRFERMVVDTG